MKKRILVVLIVSILTLLGIEKSSSIKEYIGLVMDKIGITQNTYDIHIDEDLRPYIYIYWTGDNGVNDSDKILLYHRSYFQEIPNYYGKNKFLIQTESDSVLYNRIGILKLHAYSKHNYKIDLNLSDTLLILSWSIDNWYSEKTTMTDTIVYKK